MNYELFIKKMKLSVKNMWFPEPINKTMDELFKIPQVREQFDQGWDYSGDLRPRAIKISPGYWPAQKVLDVLPDPKKDVYLILTGMNLKGDFGRIHGRGCERRAIISSDGFVNGDGILWEVSFSATAFGEIGHALGLKHHEYNSRNPCEMSHNEIPGPDWKKIEKVRLCKSCYAKLRNSKGLDQIISK